MSSSQHLDEASGPGQLEMYPCEITNRFPFVSSETRDCNGTPSLYIIIKSLLLMLRGLMEGLRQTQNHLLGQTDLLKEYYTLMNKLVPDWLELQFSFSQ